MQPLAVDDGIPRRLDEADVLESDAFHFLRRPLRTALHVRLMLRQRADGRNGEVVLEFGDVPVAVGVDEVDDLNHGSFDGFNGFDGFDGFDRFRSIS
jgi:hypothetical protein